MPRNHYFIIDSFPLAVCKPERARYSQSFRSYGADYGTCPSKKETYFDYKVHAIITLKGFITTFDITPTFIDDRDSLRDMVANCRHLVILDDKGYFVETLVQKMKEQSVCLMSLKRCNGKIDWSEPVIS